MKRVGVFVCHCGLNIAANIDVGRVVSELADYSGVVFAGGFENLCLDRDLGKIKELAAEKKLEAVVMTTCSPTLHHPLLCQAVASVGLAPDYCQVVDIKSDEEREIATQKAIDLIKNSVDSLEARVPTAKVRIKPVKNVLVIGGGIAGIAASLDMADGGYQVYLVERTQSIGGHMIQYSETFPTLDCPQCIETPLMTDTGQHPNIKIFGFSEIEEVSGHIGNFKVKVRKKAAYVDWDKCTGCLMCIEKCPVKVLSEYERYLDLPGKLAHRKAIWIPHAQAVPLRPIIDTEHCIHFTKGKCGVCQKICGKEAIDFSQQDSFVDIEVGAIIVATGFELMPKSHITEFEQDPDVIEGIEFERILCPAGPTAGKVIRPSDGKEPKEVVFISCCGSRDPEHGVPYCSKVCCTYLAKMGILFQHAVPDGRGYIFYIDIRTTGKGYEEFRQRAEEEHGVIYLRGRVSKVFREGDKIRVWGADTLTGKRVEISADLVVLGMAMLPSPGIRELAQKLGIALDENGFVVERHPKLHPLETTVPGIYVAGVAQGPKDIQDTVAQGSGAGAKVLELLAQEEIVLEEAAVS